ncbi:hypothetical protein DXD68_04810 [Parabacteroides sp. TM07-1AC]|uniref:hypothetical protein n=1 Tax=Parabacteroides sp. TM07-1AC TaxID=2292363 RepID=UPI000EFFA033|nr:hypothetical protein [Parabacteroides sp. TM07-1AC]RHU28805.1 hypothetical protein DXD68_04810 [Parabacteroides sp. TM07-1AC]
MVIFFMVIQKYIILGRYGNYLGQKQNKACLSCFLPQYLVSLEGGEVVADALGKINDALDSFADVLNNIAEGVGNNLHRQKNTIRSDIIKDKSE